MTEPTPTTWTIHLAARRPGRAIAAGVAIALALFAVRALGGSPSLIILAALFLLIATAEFFLPITYTLNADGINISYPGHRRRLPWKSVRRVYLLPNGIQLSPLDVRSWRESFRGVLLRTDRRDELLVQLQAWLHTMGISPEFVEER